MLFISEGIFSFVYRFHEASGIFVGKSQASDYK